MRFKSPLGGEFDGFTKEQHRFLEPKSHVAFSNEFRMAPRRRGESTQRRRSRRRRRRGWLNPVCGLGS